jgi:hypothetical protein
LIPWLLACAVPGPRGPASDSDSDAVVDRSEATIEGVPVTCAQPELRDSLGPLTRVSVPVRVDAAELDPAAPSGLAVADLDGDGDLDLLLPQSGADQILLQSDSGAFEDATSRLWPELRARPTVALQTLDVDGDGDLDVFASHLEGPDSGGDNALFLNDGAGGLSDASVTWGVDQQTRSSFGASFGDLDGDGDLDMAVANNDPCPFDLETQAEDCGALLELPSAQILYEQRDGRFVDISSSLPSQPLQASLAHVVSLVDLDEDGDLDLYVSNDDRQEVPFAEGNLAFFNDGTGRLSRDSGTGLEVSLESMGTGLGFLNEDARPDLFVSGTRRAALLLSEADGTWTESSQAWSIDLAEDEHRTFGWGTELADLDNDGDQDAVMVFGWLPPDTDESNPLEQRDALFLNESPGFVQVAEDWGWSDPGYGRGVAVVDLNGDGWLDLLKRELGGGLAVDLARCGEEAWLTLTLDQPGPNRDAIGARVELTSGERSWTRVMLGDGTSLSTGLPRQLHFGLGEVEAIEALTVTWPDGEASAFQDLDVRQHLRVTRGEP